MTTLIASEGRSERCVLGRQESRDSNIIATRLSSAQTPQA